MHAVFGFEINAKAGSEKNFGSTTLLVHNRYILIQKQSFGPKIKPPTPKKTTALLSISDFICFFVLFSSQVPLFRFFFIFFPPSDRLIFYYPLRLGDGGDYFQYLDPELILNTYGIPFCKRH